MSECTKNRTTLVEHYVAFFKINFTCLKKVPNQERYVLGVFYFCIFVRNSLGVKFKSNRLCNQQFVEYLL